MRIEEAIALKHSALRGDYRELSVHCPAIASRAKPGQFVHLRVPNLENSVLRRPFSIYRADAKSFSILYKQVGRGTAAMGGVAKGDRLSFIGPLGNGFPMTDDATYPAIVAGGYGVAPLAFLARRLARKGIAFLGGATAKEVLCAQDFRELGWETRIATEDGSLGEKGLVTDILDLWLEEREKASGRPRSMSHAAEKKRGLFQRPEFYACGPDGMLEAVGRRAIENGWNAWLSLDKRMACGVGACLACVQRIRNADGDEVWARVCREGPVFEARQIVW